MAKTVVVVLLTRTKRRILVNDHEGHVETASGNVASMREPLDGSLWWYWVAANAAKKIGAFLKITIVDHRRPSS